MPRDVNGNYSLPAGNPVVSGTAISSLVHNNTTSDLATAMTDSLSRTGLGGMLAPLQFGDGSAANPSISFTDEVTTGVFRNAAGEFNISILATKVLTVADDGVFNEQPYYEWNAGLAAYTALLNAADNYTILGDWNFSALLTVNGVKQVSKGRYTYHDDSTYGSAAIFVSTSAPSGGSDGDVWYQIEP
jgi:hypothetical protein